MMTYLGSNLRRLRRERDLTQAQLAERTGFDQSYISRLERGLRPSHDSHINTLAAALGVTTQRLLRRSRQQQWSALGAVSVPAVKAFEAIPCRV
jgi:transcriptional regulator with XRE-family HTH domain